MAGKRRRKSVASPCLSLQHSLQAEKVFSNIDLLTQILLRLPAVSVVRFKSIAKQWRSIISDSKFAKTHTRMNPKPTVSGLYLSSTTPQPYVRDLIPISFGTHKTLPKLPFEKSGSSLKYKDSSNGLFLFSYGENGGQTQGYLICNPTTHSYKRLPQPPAFYGDANLAYFPSKDVYKVVSVYRLSSSSIKFQIFSSDTASWKKVTALVGEWKFKPCHCRTRFVYWDGGIHWLDGYKEQIHFRFDVNNEKLEAVAIPAEPKIYGCHKVWYFGACGGRLFLIQARVSTVTGFRVLEMGEGCSGWIVRFRFNLRLAFPTAKGKFKVRHASVLRVVVGDEENEAQLVIVGAGKVVSYNLERKTRKLLSCSVPWLKSAISNDFGFEFQGTLACP